MRTFVINLDRSPERLKHMRRELGRIGVDFTRRSAVDGRLLGEKEQPDFKAKHPFDEGWSAPAIACFLSHHALWQEIAESDQPCVVLEDDIYVADDLKTLVGSAEWLPPDADHVRLEAIDKARLARRRRLKSTRGRSLYAKPEGRLLGSAAYVLTPAGAAKLLRAGPGTHCAVDRFLHNSELVSYQVAPAVCIQTHLCPGRGDGFESLIAPAELIRPKKIVAKPFLSSALLPWKARPVPFVP